MQKKREKRRGLSQDSHLQEAGNLKKSLCRAEDSRKEICQGNNGKNAIAVRGG